ncbi:MAG: type II toxin-antitoxin system RatA family toxin, partial [Rickettsiales bacterium]
MHHHKEIKYLPFKPIELFNIVLDIESYPQFIPWCSGARITERSENHLLADLVINYKGVNTQYTSKVEFSDTYTNNGKYHIKVDHIKGPFKKLTNNWAFSLGKKEGEVKLEFEIDFEMSSSILNKMIGVVFHSATHKMVEAFEKRAYEV